MHCQLAVLVLGARGALNAAQASGSGPCTQGAVRGKGGVEAGGDEGAVLLGLREVHMCWADDMGWQHALHFLGAFPCSFPCAPCLCTHELGAEYKTWACVFMCF